MIQAIPAFDDNYIWAIAGNKSGPVAVVDPGDPQPVLEFLETQGLTLGAMLITHHHGDHTGGIKRLQSEAPRGRGLSSIPVFGPAQEDIAGVTHPLREGNVVELAEMQLSVRAIEVPGHTRGHIAYFGRCTDQEHVLFCGDTLFAGGCGRLFEGSAEQMWSSLQKLAALPADTAVYCTHEYTLSNFIFARHTRPDHAQIQKRYAEVAALRQAKRITLPSSIGLELQTNPFLLCADATAFADMRRQKDQFRG
ncbi:MAG: hydroxyacylglutathione hydrolase [Burkholderiaceae bacterium]|nr:hydroxyacylglutathione hydrolase [Burkholderiaceae bacterium]